MKYLKNHLIFNAEFETALIDSHLLFSSLEEETTSKNILSFTSQEYTYLLKQLNSINNSFNSKFSNKFIPIVRFDCILDKNLKVKCIETNSGTPAMFVDVGTNKVINQKILGNTPILDEFEKNFLNIFSDKSKEIYVLIPKYDYDQFEINYLENILINHNIEINFIDLDGLKDLKNSYVINLINKNELIHLKKTLESNKVILINSFDGQNIENKEWMIELSKLYPDDFCKTSIYSTDKSVESPYLIKKNISNQGNDIKLIVDSKVLFDSLSDEELNIAPSNFIVQEYIESITFDNRNILLTFFSVNGEVSSLLFLEASDKNDCIITSSSNLLCHIVD